MFRFFLIIFLFVFPQIAFSKSTSTSYKVMALSDIHFSPYAGCKNNLRVCPVIAKLNAATASEWPKILETYSPKELPETNQVTNYTLIKSMLEQLKLQKPDSVIILGDFLAHRYRSQYLLYSQDKNRQDYNAFVEKTMQFLLNSIQASIPNNSSIFPVIGNNDSYGGPECKYPDYCTIPNGPFLTDMARLWLSLLKNPSNSFTDTFGQGGYYHVTIPNTDDHIIVLNTVLFSAKALGTNIDSAAQKQLSWLNDQLQTIADKGQKTWILFHIPPGIDSYATAKSLFQTVVPFWKDDYSQSFLQLINKYNPIITGVLSGHTHMDGFLILNDQQANQDHKIIDTFVPSISPIFGNNPGYKIFTFKDNFKLQQVSTYYLDLKSQVNFIGIWQKEYSLNNIDQLDSITRQANNTINSDFIRYYRVSTDLHSFDQKSWDIYWCSTRFFSSKDFRQCLQ